MRYLENNSGNRIIVQKRGKWVNSSDILLLELHDEILFASAVVNIEIHRCEYLPVL